MSSVNFPGVYPKGHGLILGVKELCREHALAEGVTIAKCMVTEVLIECLFPAPCISIRRSKQKTRFIDLLAFTLHALGIAHCQIGTHSENFVQIAPVLIQASPSQATSYTESNWIHRLLTQLLREPGPLLRRWHPWSSQRQRSKGTRQWRHQSGIA